MTTEVRACECVNVLVFQAGSGTRTLRPMVQVPFNTRENGAKFQDERYGKGRRLHNVSVKNHLASCTVCGKNKGL